MILPRDSCFLSLPWPLCCHIAEIVLGQCVAIHWILVSSPQLNEQKVQEGLALEKSFPLCTRFSFFQDFSELFLPLFTSLHVTNCFSSALCFKALACTQCPLSCFHWQGGTNSVIYCHLVSKSILSVLVWQLSTIQHRQRVIWLFQLQHSLGKRSQKVKIFRHKAKTGTLPSGGGSADCQEKGNVRRGRTGNAPAVKFSKCKCICFYKKQVALWRRNAAGINHGNLQRTAPEKQQPN